MRLAHPIRNMQVCLHVRTYVWLVHNKCRKHMHNTTGLLLCTGVWHNTTGLLLCTGVWHNTTGLLLWYMAQHYRTASVHRCMPQHPCMCAALPSRAMYPQSAPSLLLGPHRTSRNTLTNSSLHKHTHRVEYIRI